MLRAMTQFFKSTPSTKHVFTRTIYAGLDFKKYPARVTTSFLNKDSVALKSDFPLEPVTLTDKILGSYEQSVLRIKNGVILPGLKNGFYRHQSYKAIDLDLLYSIPQPVWEEFIRGLNQKVIDALNLKKYRHLWNAYNYAIEASREEIALERAQLVEQHHFVLAILYYNNLEQLFSPSLFRSYSNDEMYELKGNCNRFQRSLKERNFFDYELAQTLHPVFTPRFIHKVAHCSDISEVVRFADAILYYSSTTTISDTRAKRRFINIRSVAYELNRKKSLDAINWLASSTKSPEEFSQSVKFISTLRDLNIGFFFSSRKNWNKSGISERDNQHISDYMEALFDDLILRQILQKMQEENIREEFDHTPPKILYKFKQLIATSQDVLHINELQERWHRKLQVIEEAKPFSSKRIWKPLIATTYIDGITITPITSEITLKSHGKEMRSCVGGYAKRCVANEANIFELVDAQNIKSTLNVWCIKGKIGIQQHRGYHNTFPNEQHYAVAKELVRQINEEIIPLNQTRLNEHPTFSRMYTEVPYDVNELEKIYQIYKTLKVLPPILIAVNFQKMLEQSGLRDFIEKVVAGENPSRKIERMGCAMKPFHACNP